MAPRRLRFQLPLDAARLLRARHRIRDYLHDHHVEPRAADDIVLAIQEAMTNAVRHSGADGLSVTLAFVGRDLAADVTDEGRGFDVTTFDPRVRPSLDAPGGRGLFLIAHLMDELELRVDGGLEVHITKRDALPSGEQESLALRLPGGRADWDRREQLMLDEIEDEFFAFDWEYRLVHANAAVSRITDRPPQELLGKAFGELFPASTALTEAVEKAMQLGVPGVAEYDSVLVPGHWYEAHVYPSSFGLNVFSTDITERRGAEAALRRSEARFRAVLEDSLDAAYRRDLRTDRYDYLSPVIEAITGFSADEMGGMPVAEVVERIHPDDRETVLRALGLSEETGRLSLEYRFRRKDDREVWLADNAVVRRDEAGSLSYRSGVVRDISDRKAAEAALQRSELFYRQTLESIPGLVFTARCDGHVDYLSGQWEEYTGVPTANDLGDGWLGLLHPDDRANTLAVWQKAIERDELDNVEHRLRRRDGVYEWFKAMAVPIHDAEGHIVRWFGVATNVEELKRAEGALRASEAEKAQLYELERRRHGRLQALHQALDVALSSLEPAEASRRMLQCLVAEHGFEYANVWRYEGDCLKLLAALGYDERYQAAMPSLPLSAPHDVVQVFLTGEPVVVADAAAESPAVELHRRLGLPLGSFLILPLPARGVTVGTLHLGWSTPHEVAPDDLDFYLSLSGELGVVLENARLYEEQRGLALTLQRNFVHPLPVIRGLELAALSQPAAAPERVGGDFHDIFEASGGLVVALIGDVMGKGIAAAGMTETVRSAVRALSEVSASAAFLLEHVNRMLLREDHEQLVTVVLLILEPSTGRCCIASAGHPPPVLLTSAGPRRVELQYGPPLGSFECAFVPSEFDLDAGDALVLYTDGLTEARDVDLFGEARLLATLDGCYRLGLEALVTKLRDAAVAHAGELKDDLEILALRRA